MSAEFMAEKLIDHFIDDLGAEADFASEENVLSGGYWFTATYRGKHYEVSVVEVTSR